MGGQLVEFFSNLFSADFMPHGHCFFWRPEILWLHVVSDAVTALSYLMIPFAFIRLVRARRDLAFNWMFLLFGLFILACGTTHALAIVTLWHPVYRIEGVFKLLTAIASFPTALLLWRLVPQAALIPSQRDLATVNESLQLEVGVRREAEEAAKRLAAELENRVAERTKELESLNAELRESTAELAAREQEYRKRADLTPMMIWTADQNGSVTYFNRYWAEYTGASTEESTGEGWAPVIHPDDLDKVKRVWGEAISTGHDLYLEHRIRRASDGMYRWHLGRARANRDGRGVTTGWFGTTADIHDEVLRREESDRELFAVREREEVLHALTNLMPQLAWTAKASGETDFFNQRWMDYTGLSMAESIGGGWVTALHPDDVEPTIAAWKEAVTTDTVYDINYRLRKASSGQFRWFLARGVPIREEDGTIGRWFGTCTDIDEHRRTEAALRLANTDLEHFAYAATHDLQEPLRAMSSYAELLQRRYGHELSVEARGFASTIVTSAKRMSMLLRDLRSYIHANTKEEEGQRVAAETTAVLAEVRDDLAILINEAQANIEVGPMPTVWVEATHLRQLFTNLIGNGLKYRRDAVPAAIRIWSTAEDRYWRFAVEDNGEGVPEEYRAKIFGIFTRLHGQSKSGSGMGLAICARIVARYGGRIWVEENAGGGSTFYFTLPRYLPPTADAE